MIEASAGVKSLGVKLNIAQDISNDADGVIITSETKLDCKIIQEPFSQYHQIELIWNNEAVGDQHTKLEQYLTDEGFFMYDTMSDKWGKYNADYSGVAKQLNLQQGTNQLDFLKDLDSFTDDFTLEKEADQYILTLSGNDGELNEYVKKSMPANLPEIKEAMKSMKINNVQYEIIVDKKTNLPSVMNVDMNINITTNGNKIFLEQSIDSNYYDYNKIDKIQLPKEAIDNPYEINLNDPISM